MSKVFNELCSDAAEQFSAGIPIKQIQSNISFVAEQYGMSMVASIAVAERFGRALKTLHTTGQGITESSVSTEFIKLSVRG